MIALESHEIAMASWVWDFIKHRYALRSFDGRRVFAWVSPSGSKATDQKAMDATQARALRTARIMERGRDERDESGSDILDW